MSESGIDEDLRLADGLWKSGKLQEAEKMLREIRRKDPKCWQVYFFLGGLLFELQRPANAASMFRTVLELSKHSDIPEESLDIVKEGLDLTVRTGWSEPAHPLRKQLLTVHDKLEADIAARDEKAIAYATGMLRGELNRVRETIERYLFVHLFKSGFTSNLVKTNLRPFPSLGLMRILAAPLRVALGLRRGRFVILTALFAGAFLLAANARGEFLYTANIGDGSISGYTIGTDGNLTPITGSPFTTGGQPSTVGVDKAGGFLYASLQQPGEVAGFSISANGALTPVPGSPFSVGQTILSLAVDSHGGFVYATAQSNGVFAYSIGSNGSLKLIAGSPFRTGHEVFSATVDPTGKFLYVCNVSSKTVSGFHIESTGALKKISKYPFPVDSGPTYIALDPVGKFAYVSDPYANSIKIERVAQNGALTQLGQTRLDNSANAAVDPTGKFLYATDDSTNTVVAYSIGSTGRLTPVPNSPFATGSGPFGIVVDLTGAFVYVASGNSVFGYRIGSNGALSPLSGSPFGTGSGPYRLTVAP